MLTVRETEMLSFIGRYMREFGGVAPTRAEIASGMGFASKGWIQVVVQRLEQKGYLRRLRGKARAIELTTYFVFDETTKELKPMPAKEAMQTVDRAA
jgi:SOS-response transcriptional repressor LexA